VAVVERLCGFCRTPLATSRPNKLYCGSKCRARAAKRRQRPTLELVSLPEHELRELENVEAELLETMLGHARLDWKANRWLLQVLNPQRWGRPL
jgi:hypothetical protein